MDGRATLGWFKTPMVGEVFKGAAHQRHVNGGLTDICHASHLGGITFGDMLETDDQLAKKAVLFFADDTCGAAPWQKFGVSFHIDHQRIKLRGGEGRKLGFGVAWHKQTVISLRAAIQWLLLLFKR